MSTQSSEATRTGGLGHPHDDFPFYDGEPVAISPGQWLFVLAAVAMGFTCLVVPLPILDGVAGGFIRAVLFPLIPLVALRIVAGPHWRAIFRRVRGRDLLWMVAFALLNLVLSSLIGLLIMHLFGAEANLALSGFADRASGDLVMFFLDSLPQLFGEEVLTILPFLAILYLGHSELGLSRTAALLVAWLLSSILFGLVHLPSYNWNWVQCIFVIGSARLVLTLAYILTRNIWVSTGAHIINDWLIFGFILFASTQAPTG